MSDSVTPDLLLTSYDDFQALREQRRAAHKWKRLHRAHNDRSSENHRDVRTTFRDKEAGKYYTEQEAVLWVNTGIDPATFLDTQEAFATLEFKCFQIAPKLGFQVPDPAIQVTRRIDRSSSDFPGSRAVFQSALATKEVKGHDMAKVKEILAGKDKLKRIILRWAMQAIGFGIAIRDGDRVRLENALLTDIKSADPEEIVHLDFEDVRDPADQYFAEQIITKADNVYREVTNFEEGLPRDAVVASLEHTHQLLHLNKAEIAAEDITRIDANLLHGIDVAKSFYMLQGPIIL
jgi:hypothetical protein